MNSCQFLLLQVPLLWQCLWGSPGRSTGRRRPDVNLKHIWYRWPTSCGHRLDARRPADATIFGTHITDARPMTHDDRPMQNRPVGRVSSRLKAGNSLNRRPAGRPTLEKWNPPDVVGTSGRRPVWSFWTSQNRPTGRPLSARCYDFSNTHSRWPTGRFHILSAIT